VTTTLSGTDAGAGVTEAEAVADALGDGFAAGAEWSVQPAARAATAVSATTGTARDRGLTRLASSSVSGL